MPAKNSARILLCILLCAGEDTLARKHGSPAKGMCSRKGDQATVIKAHAIEDIAQVVCSLRGIWETAVLWARFVFFQLVRAAWPPRDVRPCMTCP